MPSLKTGACRRRKTKTVCLREKHQSFFELRFDGLASVLEPGLLSKRLSLLLWLSLLKHNDHSRQSLSYFSGTIKFLCMTRLCAC